MDTWRKTPDFRDNLMCFLSDFNLCSKDLLYRDYVKFTYGGSVRSWPDHVLTLQHHSGIICDIHSVYSPCNFSDHALHAFLLKLDVGVNGVLSRSTSKGPYMDITLRFWLTGRLWVQVTLRITGELYFTGCLHWRLIFLVVALSAVRCIMRNWIPSVIRSLPVSLVLPQVRFGQMQTKENYTRLEWSGSQSYSFSLTLEHALGRCWLSCSGCSVWSA